MNSPCGVINIYKERGYTSHDVVAIVRKILNTKKVGHTGTLDPNAEGVLPICIGKATKVASLITDGTKRYVAVVHLGLETDTEDITGSTIREKDVIIDKEEIENIVSSFKGKISQTPPMYSAIKVEGKKLYELAREGKTIERKSREVHIFEIKVLDFLNDNKFRIEVLCSKGTYIRTLCKDIGEKIGCGACMGELTRVSSGEFHICKSIKLDELKRLAEDAKLENAIIGFERIFKDVKRVSVKSEANKFLYNGNKISENYLIIEKSELSVEEEILIYDDQENLIGLYEVIIERQKKAVKPIIMLN